MKKLFLVGLMMLFASPVFACTAEKKVVIENNITRYVYVLFTWTSNSLGADSGCSQTLVSGRLDSVRFIPNDGTTQPTDLYDVTVLDEYGEDVLKGMGGNLSNTRTDDNNERSPRNPDDGSINRYNATLTPYITNAGNTKGGKIEMIWK